MLKILLLALLTVSCGPYNEALWPLGAVRWFAVDNENGSDGNTGFSDISAADAKLHAIKTFARLAEVLPKEGADRIGKVMLKSRADGGVFLDSNGQPDLIDQVLEGLQGYSNIELLGTGDGPSAGVAAFDDNPVAESFAGAVPCAGTNPGGYNLTATFPVGTNPLLFVPVNGLPAEPAEPLGYRVRFVADTTTAALRNVSRTVIQVASFGAAVDTAWPVMWDPSDVVVFEKPGVVIQGTWGHDWPGGVGNVVLGIQTLGQVSFVGGSHNLIFCGGTGGLVALNQDIFNTAPGYREPLLNNAMVYPGGGYSTMGTAHIEQGRQLLINLFSGNAQIENPDIFGWQGAAFGAIGIFGGSFRASTPSNLQVRLQGTLTLDSIDGLIGGVISSGAGSKPAVKVRGITHATLYQILGSMGNLDVGLDLTQATLSDLDVRATQVSGALGDVREADGTIVPWSTFGPNVVEDSAGNRIRWRPQ